MALPRRHARSPVPLLGTRVGKTCLSPAGPSSPQASGPDLFWEGAGRVPESGGGRAARGRPGSTRAAEFKVFRRDGARAFGKPHCRVRTARHGQGLGTSAPLCGN
jgi:hypothetical protein